MSASMESSSSSVSSASPESSVTSPPSSTPSIFEDDKVPFTAGANYLPSPFYPPTLAATDAISAQWLAPSLPAEYPPLPSHVQPVTRGDDKDKGTPDEWVLRDERLVRLTGKWPFNCEAPLPDLFNAGFITPTRLFYVRNHGVVPRVSLADAHAWTLEISGMVKNPVTLRLSDLLDPTKFSPVTLPVTLVCAGNRRKEQNVVRQSLGFSWGPAGLSTALFTGVFLADVLTFVNPQNEGVFGSPGFKRAEHVIFEGAEDLPNGKYGTSQRLRWARQKTKGMLLAWAMNGEALEPDHGYPLRLVVPGQIGGRSVKWLKKIIVSDKESQHHLHFWDNKVLPTTLMPEQARKEKKWWYDPRYIINDLNTNSAIARPAHDEQLIIPAAGPSSPATYTVEGYAYAGGGRRVNRVEITLNEGETWQLADITYPEDSFRTRPFQSPVWGTFDLTESDECFCWVFWKAVVEVDKLKDSGSIAVRGMDEGLSGQGKSMYWNPTGMMNNWWFRVAIHTSFSPSTNDTILIFEHPTQPGTLPGGWMTRLKDDGEDILNPAFTTGPKAEDVDIDALSKQAAKVKKAAVVMTKAGVDRKITMEEVRAHSLEASPWFIVHGEVYDGTAFLKTHPGGSESITLVAGEDASEDFMAIHSPAAKSQLADYHIGTLIPSGAPTESSTEPTAPDPTFLHKTKWKAAKLVNIHHINHDSRIYKFELEYPDQLLGLPTGQHVYARLRRKVSPADAEGSSCKTSELVEGELVQRAYTPVSSSDAKGFLEMLIKVYHRTPLFPEGGKMTLGFEELVLGDCVEFKGPLGSFEWKGKGVAKWRGVERRAKKLGFICGGSGITPIIQVLRGVINDPEDTDTMLWVLNANKTEADILLRAELEILSERAGSSRYRQHLVLSKADADWKHSKGRITKEMLKTHLPEPDDDALILICGPDPMINDLVKPGLTELGWDISTSLVVF